MVTQVLSAIVAATALWVIAHGLDGLRLDGDRASRRTGTATARPAGYGWWAVLLAEVLLTAFFLYIILGVTDTSAPKGFAPLAIGLALSLIHLVSIPISNTSVNPARSIGPALFAGADPILQLWMFIPTPLLGALIAGVTYTALVRAGGVVPLEETTQA